MIPRRVADRLARSIQKFAKVLQTARDRDVNESDTVSIIKDMLTEIFGYDKYLEITSEFAIRGTYCDLAIKIDSKIEFLIEAKAVGLDLRESHLRQVTEYGANTGAQWVILTNGFVWQVYKIRFEKPIDHDLVCEFSFDEIDPKNEEHLEELYIICKEGLAKDAREEFHQKILTVNRFILGALILSDEVVAIIRRELRKFSDGVLITPEEITRVLRSEVVKREVLEGDEAERAHNQVKRFYGKIAKRTKEMIPEKAESDVAEPSDQAEMQAGEESPPEEKATLA